MKVVFYASDKPREHMLAEAVRLGCEAYGDKFEMRRTGDYGELPDGTDLKWPGPSPDTDVAVCFGVKGKSKKIIEDHRAMGRATLYLDKGYTRTKGEGSHTEYSRACVNATHPLGYMMRIEQSRARWRRLNMKLGERPRKQRGGHILFCGSSQKYCDFHDLGDANAYASRVLRRIRQISERPFVYRPKPSWRGAVVLPGTSLSTGATTITEALRGCWAVVTHGSSAAMDAVFAGVPAITLGPGIANPVCAQTVEEIEHPFWADGEARYRWACAMAHCQWTVEEFRTGEAWRDLRAEILWQREHPIVEPKPEPEPATEPGPGNNP